MSIFRKKKKEILRVDFYSGIPTEEEQAVIEKKIQDKFGGDCNVEIFVTFNEPRSQAPTIQIIK